MGLDRACQVWEGQWVDCKDGWIILLVGAGWVDCKDPSGWRNSLERDMGLDRACWVWEGPRA